MTNGHLRVAADTPTPGTGSISPLRRTAFAGYRWLLLIFLLLGVVQIFLAGFGVFSLHGAARPVRRPSARTARSASPSAGRQSSSSSWRWWPAAARGPCC